MQFRTFGWIARQNPHIRMLETEIIDNKRFIFAALKGKKIESPVEERKTWFKRGELWPTLLLVEKAWDEEGRTLSLPTSQVATRSLAFEEARAIVSSEWGIVSIVGPAQI